MRRLRAVVAYDGTGFWGFQRLPDYPTVQGQLEACLSRVCGERVQVVGAGRTDAGVHASGQVVHFDIAGRIPVERLGPVVNRMAAPGVVMRAVDPAPEGFHARYSARQRTYRYYLTRAQPSPFIGRYVVYDPYLGPGAAERMREALPALLGTHDFVRLGAVGPQEGSTVRTVRHAGVTERGPGLTVEITADGFLRNMVRRIVGVLIEIGQGRRPTSAFGEALRLGEPWKESRTAPPHGLFFTRVEYDDGYPGELPGLEGDLPRLAGAVPDW